MFFLIASPVEPLGRDSRCEWKGTPPGSCDTSPGSAHQTASGSGIRTSLPPAQKQPQRDHRDLGCISFHIRAGSIDGHPHKGLGIFSDGFLKLTIIWGNWFSIGMGLWRPMAQVMRCRSSSNCGTPKLVVGESGGICGRDAGLPVSGQGMKYPSVN